MKDHSNFGAYINVDMLLLVTKSKRYIFVKYTEIDALLWKSYVHPAQFEPDPIILFAALLLAAIPLAAYAKEFRKSKLHRATRRKVKSLWYNIFNVCIKLTN